MYSWLIFFNCLPIVSAFNGMKYRGILKATSTDCSFVLRSLVPLPKKIISTSTQSTRSRALHGTVFPSMVQGSISLADSISWNEIEDFLPAEPKKLPAKLTFYRDTNGWCPFCERVWIALEHKQIEYDTITINLKDKPQWFKDIVPTALVPAIELHNSAWTSQTRGSGKMMWESMDILNSLDDLFPDTPRLR
jgi:hypothetical protein